MLPGMVFLAVALVSSLLSSHVHDALLSWLDYFTAGLAFVVAADVTCELTARGWRPAPILAWLVIGVAFLVMPAAIARFLADTGKDYGAMVGSFYQPNMFSSYLEFGLGAGLALYLGTRRGWPAGLVVAVLLIGVYRSYSQGALIVAWAILLLVLALLRSRRAFFWILGAVPLLLGLALLGFRGHPAFLVLAGCFQLALLAVLLTRWRLLKLLVLGVLAVGMTLQVVPAVAKVDAAQQALTMARGTDANVHARFAFYESALAIFKQHPVIGVGPQGFQRYYPASQRDVRYFSKFTHCIWLTILCETGILGLIPVVVGCVMVFWCCLRVVTPARAGLLVGCLGFLAHSSVDVQWEFMSLPLTFALLMGVLVGETLEEAPSGELDEEPRSEMSIRPELMLHFLVAVVLFGLGYLNVLAVFSERLLASGLAQTNARDYQQAERDYRQALIYDPFSGENYRFLALLLMASMKTAEQKAEVLGLAERAASLDGHRPVTQSLLGQVRSELGDKAGARVAYQRALEIDPVNYPAFYMELANLEADTGHSDRAVAILAEARRRFPVDSLSEMLAFRADALREPLSMVYAASGASENPTRNPERAAEYFKVALSLQPNNPDALFGMGAAELTLGNVPAAIGYLEKVDKLMPDFPPCLTFLERAYRLSGDKARAEAVRGRLEKLR